MPNRTCVCNHGFTGDTCERRLVCPDGCEAHGTCNEARTCECHPGWRGDACDEELTCASDCSGHGRCDEGACRCDEGYRGEACDEYLAPSRPPGKPNLRRFEIERAMVPPEY